MQDFDPVELTTDVVAAFVSNNSVPRAELAGLIENVHAALLKLVKGEPAPPPVEIKEPAVSVRKSITPDYMICLEDGKRFKSLKRHLGTLGLTPEQYRAKWDLPSDYPMVAPNYSAKRSALAKENGLGQLAKSARRRRSAKSGD